MTENFRFLEIELFFFFINGCQPTTFNMMATWWLSFSSLYKMFTFSSSRMIFSAIDGFRQTNSKIWKEKQTQRAHLRHYNPVWMFCRSGPKKKTERKIIITTSNRKMYLQCIKYSIISVTNCSDIFFFFFSLYLSFSLDYISIHFCFGFCILVSFWLSSTGYNSFADEGKPQQITYSIFNVSTSNTIKWIFTETTKKKEETLPNEAAW